MSGTNSVADNANSVADKHSAHGKIRVRNVKMRTKYPRVPNYENIPAYSKGKGEWKQLSPFIIGPVEYTRDGKEKSAKIFENFWQGHKVWEKVDTQNQANWSHSEEYHIDLTTGNPNSKWKKWHNKLLSHDKPVRRPNGRMIPEYAWWDNERLDIVSARKKIYIPHLQKLYRQNSVYSKLLKMVASGQNVIILEYDGFPMELYPDGLDVDYDMLVKLQDVVKCSDSDIFCNAPDQNKYVPYGHGYVLALTLLEDIDKYF